MTYHQLWVINGSILCSSCCPSVKLFKCKIGSTYIISIYRIPSYTYYIVKCFSSPEKGFISKATMYYICQYSSNYQRQQIQLHIALQQSVNWMRLWQEKSRCAEARKISSNSRSSTSSSSSSSSSSSGSNRSRSSRCFQTSGICLSGIPPVTAFWGTGFGGACASVSVIFRQMLSNESRPM